MITLPRRSVTRFFIPLIDVLILLFCIFLLMPFVSGPPSETADPKPPPKDPLPTNVADLQRELAEARDRLKRMDAAARAHIADRLSVRVLQVGKDGSGIFVYYYDPDRQEIRTEADALKLIARQKTIASSAGGVKDVMFLVMYPRDENGNLRGYPTQRDEQTILGWFRDVPLKFE